jgi:hypothetical protein
VRAAVFRNEEGKRLIRWINFPTNGLEPGKHEGMNATGPGECPSDFNGIEVGGVWRQEREPCADVFQDRGGLRAAVGGKDIQDHHVALVLGRGRSGFDATVEEWAMTRRRFKRYGAWLIGPPMIRGASSPPRPPACHARRRCPEAGDQATRSCALAAPFR